MPTVVLTIRSSGAIGRKLLTYREVVVLRRYMHFSAVLHVCQTLSCVLQQQTPVCACNVQLPSG